MKLISSGVATMLVLCPLSIAVAQIKQVDLTAIDPADETGYGATIQGGKAVFCFGGHIVRFSLADKQQECQLFDLSGLPSMSGPRGQPGFLRFSDDAKWLILEHADKDPSSESNCYLFDAFIWNAGDQIEPRASWYTPNMHLRVSQILPAAGIVLLAKGKSERFTTIEVRRLDSASTISSEFRVRNRFVAAWLDTEKKLTVLSSNHRNPSKSWLAAVDLATGRTLQVIQLDISLTASESFCRLPQTANLALSTWRSNLKSGNGTFNLTSDRPPRKLAETFLFPMICSPNGRFVAGVHAQPKLRIKDLKKEVVVVDTEELQPLIRVALTKPEVPWAIGSKGRYLLSTLSEEDVRKWILRELPGAEESSE